VTLAILWDLDGTLADTAADITLTMNETLEAHGLPGLPDATVRRFVGDGARSLVDRCVRAAGGEPRPELVAWFMDRYRRFPRRLATLYPGILELLEALDGPMAIVTNKPAQVSDELLTALGIRDRFAALVGGDSLPVRKPDPAPLRAAMATLGVTAAVMVGDGPHDVHGGHAAGLPVIGVEWGIGDPAGADRRVRNVGELREALASFGACRYR
jgi:phosphoglycolate phosphatase